MFVFFYLFVLGVPTIGLYLLVTKAQTRTSSHLVVADLACLLINFSHILVLFAESEEAIILGFKIEYFCITVFLLFFTLFFLRYLRIRKTFDIIKPWVAMASFYSICVIDKNLFKYVLYDFHTEYASSRIGLITILWFIMMALCLMASFTFMTRRLKIAVAENERYNQYRIMGSVSVIIVGLIVSLASGGRIDSMPLASSLSIFIVIQGVLQGELVGTIESGRDWVLENMDNAVIIIDAAQGYLDANNHALKLFPSLTNITRNRRVGEEVLDIINSEETYYDINGSYYEKRVRSLESQGITVGYAVLLVDVTPQVQAMSELTILKRLAEDASKSKSDFLSNMSHEIRTPMNAIVGLTELLLRSELPPKEMSYLQNIKNSCAALLTIINDILDLSKIQSGKFHIEEEQYELLSILNDLSVTFLNRIGNKPVLLLYDVDPNIPAQLKGDSARVRQILVNLLGNAVKFTESGSVKLTIKALEVIDDCVTLEFSISDTGCGIKKEDIGKLFEMFQQVDTTRNRGKEGTGLGLAISKQLVELMGGKIGVDSIYGEGSSFTFTIRQGVLSSDKIVSLRNKETTVSCYFACDELMDTVVNLSDLFGIKFVDYTNFDCGLVDFFFTDVTSAKNHEWITELAECGTAVYVMCNPMTDDYSNVMFHSANLPLYSCNFCHILNRESVVDLEENDSIDFVAPECKVLVVDDNDLNLKVASGMMEPFKVHVDVASSGSEALEKLKTNRYNIIFMDHMMPGMDGVECTSRIRESDKETIIIALTANVVSEARELFASCGMNDFVSKPFKMRDLYAVFKKWLPSNMIVKGKSEKQSTIIGDKRLLNLQEYFDIESAIKYVGSEKHLISVLEDFVCVLEGKAKKIDKLLRDRDFNNFTIEVHAMKSTARMIGALELSDKFRRLEELGKENNDSVLLVETPKTLKMLMMCKQYLKEFDIEIDSQNLQAASVEDKISVLDELKFALDKFDLDRADYCIEMLVGYEWDEELSSSIKELKAMVVDVNTAQAIPVIEEIMSKLEV